MSGVRDVPGRWAPGAWAGGQVSPRAMCLLAPNPTPWTLEGTNTWIIGQPEGSEVVVVDPGPDDPEHLRAVADHVEARGARVGLILLTHGHWDHAAGAGTFADLVRAPVRALAQPGSPGDLHDGERLTAGGVDLIVVTTPGHTSDSASFLLAEDHALLTGDTVLGWGTTVIAYPDGELAAYLRSLERLSALTGDGQVVSLWPGHGGVVDDAAGKVRFYRDHRRERLDQVRAAWQRLGDDAAAIVAEVYADSPREVWPAAELSVRAQVAYLRDHP